MLIKLILRSDVENLGRLGEIVQVKAGYGRNYLIPQGLAMPATPGNLKVFETERAKLEKQMNSLRAEAQDMAARIEALALSIPVRVGEGDKLYGSVTSLMIAEAAKEAGLEIDRRKIQLDQPLKALGTYALPIKTHADVVAELKVSIVRIDGGHVEEIVEETLIVSEPAEETTAEE